MPLQRVVTDKVLHGSGILSDKLLQIETELSEAKTWAIKNDSANYRAINIAKLGWVDYKIHNRGTVGVTFVGDSLTAGYDVTSTDRIEPQDGDWATRASMNYPYRFRSYMLEQAGVTVSPFVLRAISGYTAKRSFEKEEWKVNPNTDLAFLMFAINDSTTGDRNFEEYMDYMERLIRQYIDWGNGVVVCISAGGGLGATNPQWVYWGKRMRNMAAIYGCPFFDGQEAIRPFEAGAVQSDNTHYNSMGYAIHGMKLASMCMAGGLTEAYRPVTNEITVWPGMHSDQIGWCDATGNVGTSASPYAYTRGQVVGLLRKNTTCVMSFSFYLDAEAAHIFSKSSGNLKVVKEPTGWFNNNAKTYYKWAIENASSYGAATIREGETQSGNYTSKYNIGTGVSKFMGRILGRGWHTITIYNELGDAAVNDAYLNSITIQPVPVGCSNAYYMGATENRFYRVVNAIKLPSPVGVGSSVPPAVPLTEFTIKCPQSLLGAGGGVGNWVPQPNYFNCGVAKVRITNEKGNYYEGLIHKKDGNDLSFTVTPISQSLGSNSLTMTCSLATKAENVLVSQGAEGESQPLRAIRDFNGAVVDLKTRPANDMTGGAYLKFTLTWTSPVSGYWNIEVEGNDFFGNSEAAFGVA